MMSPAGRRYAGGPLAGTNFIDWSDRLRNVEEMVNTPDLQTQVAQIRDRARVIRKEFLSTGARPDWAVVKTHISTPLAEVRNRVDEELARRASKEALVPLDRDPVPVQFSERVKRYYRGVGKERMIAALLISGRAWLGAPWRFLCSWALVCCFGFTALEIGHARRDASSVPP